jgi:hypothetical protein
MGLVRLLSGILVVAVCCPALLAEAQSIRSAALEVTYDPSAGRFSVSAAAGAQPFIVDGKLSGAGGAARVAAVRDKTFGDGQAIEVAYPGGNRDQILLFPNLPFVLFRAGLHNGGGAASVTDKVRPFSAALDLGVPADALRVLGTGGLAAPDQKTGSYMWLAVAEPRSRRGVVAGWITADRGSGIVFAAAEDGRVRLDAQIDYGRLRLAPGRTETLETFAVGCFDDARLGLEAWADAVARVYAIKLPPQPVGYCTWYHGGASSEQKLPEQATFAAKNLKPFGFSFVQIDDGWQDGDSQKNGPRKNFTRHRAGGPYPAGMTATADGLRVKGLVPGIWFMPFAGTYNDPWFQDKQDLFARNADGKPYDTRWGGTCLDMTHPAAQEYVRSMVRRIAHGWGYRYFKMDGLWTGSATPQMYVNAGYKEDGMGDAVLHNPDKTNIEALRDGLKLVREAAGRDVFFLGCCAPQNMRSYGGAFGLVDAMRIGPDNGANWGGLLRGSTFGSRNYHLHGRIWYNDPDPLYVRASLPLAQARLICSWVTISGQLSVSSEALTSLPPERLDLLRRTMPSHGLQARPVDLFEEALPRLWLLSDTRREPRRDVIAAFNWGETPLTIDYPLERIGLAADKEYAAFEYWSNALRPPFKGNLKLTLPPHAKAGGENAGQDICAVLAVRPVTDAPQLISTSRHITQGIVDVLEEKWTAAARELSGTSQVVGGDPYELRVLTYSTRGAWKAEAADLAPEDRAAGAAATLKEEAGLARVTLQSPAGRQVRWKVRFAAAQAASAGGGAASGFAGSEH